MVEVLQAPLHGVRVVDLGCYIAGPLVGMLLADQGAEVIKVDPPAGPLFNHPVNQTLNRGKMLLALDLKSKDGLETLTELISSADILIENFSPGVMSRLGLSKDRLKTINPRLITLSLPGFTKDGQLSNATKAYEGIIAAATGQYTDIHAIRGVFGLDPVYTALPLASVYAGVHGATASVLALRERQAGHAIAPLRTPLDAAAVSAMSSIFMEIEDQPERYEAPRLPAVVKKFALPFMRWWASSGEGAQTKLLNIARKSFPAFMSSYPCADHKLLYVFAIDNLKIARRLLKAIGLYDDAIAEGLVELNPYDSGDRRDNLAETSSLSRALQTQLKVMLSERFLERTAYEWVQVLTSAGVPCTVQRSTKEWLLQDELKSAGIVVDVEQENNDPCKQPGIQTWLSKSPPRLMQPRASRSSTSPPAWTSKSTVQQALSGINARSPGRWLEGLTVIDMCSMVAGPVAGRSLAEYGARVIKVETPRPNHGPRMTCWYGVDVNQGKDSVLLDLKTELGRTTMQRLLTKADILLTNLPDEVMATFGLSEEAVHKLHPNVILARIGAYNGPQKGPWTSQNGYDPVLQAASGIMWRYGDADNPELHAIASCVDALTGYSCMFGMALALYRRDALGLGETVDASLAAAATLIQLPFASTAWQAGQEPSGQTAKGETPTYGLFQARDGWVFIAAPESEAEKVASALNLKTRAEEITATAVARIVRAMSVKKAIALLSAHEVSVTQVHNVGALKKLMRAADLDDALALVRRNISGLGFVTSAPAQQLGTPIGGLNSLKGAVKPGSDTRAILTEVNIDVQEAIQTGAAAERISDEYLPE